MSFHLVAAAARRSLGVITTAEMRRLGVPSSTIDSWVDRGLLDRLHRGVYGIGGMPPTFLRAVHAAVRAGGEGAAASHRCALALWDLRSEDIVEISIPYERQVRLHGVKVHRSTDLRAAALRRRHRVTVTDPMRAVIDSGAVLPREEVEDAFDRALAAQLFSHASMEWAYGEVARRGRVGCGMIRRMLDRRALEAEAAESLLEPRMARLLTSHRLPPAVFQHPVVIAGRRYRIDFAYPELRIAIEVDGWKKFATPRGTQEVLDRQNQLALAGWTVLRFTWADVVQRPVAVAAQIRAAVETRTVS